MKIYRRETYFAPHIVTTCMALCLGILATGWGFPCPLVDDAFYKSPAAELVEHGRLAIPCANGFLPRMEEVFACYPPLYQLMLALWYLIWGISLETSIAFSFCVHTLNSLLIVEVSRRWLRDANLRIPELEFVLPTSVGVVHLLNLAYFDRQEELALAFMWGQILLAWNIAPAWSPRRQLAIGLFGGCAALTSPWVGMLAAIYITSRVVMAGCFDLKAPLAFRWQFVVSRLFTIGGIVGILVGVWYFTLEWLYPGVIGEQFLGILRHLNLTQHRGGIVDRLLALSDSVFYSRGQFPTTALALGGITAIVVTKGFRRLSPHVGGLFMTVVVGICLLVATRPEAYTYWGAIQILSLPFFVTVLGTYFARRDESGSGVGLWGRIMVATCLCMAACDTLTHMYYACRLPETERAENVFAQLREKIPAEASVAVTSRHWLAFQGRNPWREAFFSSLESPVEVIKCEWLVLEPGRGDPYFLDQFDKVEQVVATVPAAHTYAYSLYRRRGGSATAVTLLKQP